MHARFQIMLALVVALESGVAERGVAQEGRWGARQAVLETPVEPSGSFRDDARNAASPAGRDSSANSGPAAPPRRVLPVSFSKAIDPNGANAAANRAAAGLPAANERSQGALPLAPPSERNLTKAARPGTVAPKAGLATILGSLGLVLGVFFLIVWCFRRAAPQSATALPREAVEMLGRTPLGARQYMHLVRIGNKLLLLSVTQHGAETLTEIDDAQEVERLVGICQQSQPGSVTTTFRNILAQLGAEPTTPGFLGDSHVDELEIASGPASRSGVRRARTSMRGADDE